MKFLVRDQQFLTRRLSRLYITALSTIAVLAVLAQVCIQFALLQQSSDALVINLAGRQRMLSQKLTKAALALYISSDPTAVQNREEEMKTTLFSWQQVQQGLQRGDPTLGLPGTNDETVTHLFLTITPNFQAMVDSSNAILQSVAQRPPLSHAALDAAILPPLQNLLGQEPQFLSGMDAIVAQYQLASEGRLTQLKLIELLLCGLTLVVLALEGFLIFRPALHNLRKSVNNLVKAEAQLVEHSRELERKNTELELAFAEAMAAHRKVMPNARVVAFGHYQVQGANGNYYAVMSKTVQGNTLLECECPMYQRNLICSHSLAAASLHSALLRRQQSSPSWGNTGSELYRKML